ncbi:hypothetical protein Prudu_016521 [Prunus dulcis]|uniref:Cupin type-1 domain-containing protein n=1 Tax=Prunus dulcis TaxID=3755 RepID=A0A4Y1RLM5_PRUDU|nr:hypothetical protein Prudu_016521 [Prunus dulcis]
MVKLIKVFPTMASRTSSLKFFSLLFASFAIVQMAMAGDPDIISDFLLPANGTVDANFFTYTGFRVLVGGGPPTTFKSVSCAVLEFPSGTTNPPHTHPRSAELLFLVDGTLEVGFIDTKNKPLYTDSSIRNCITPQHSVYHRIDDNVLAISFKTDVATIQKLKAGLAAKS